MLRSSRRTLSACVVVWLAAGAQCARVSLRAPPRTLVPRPARAAARAGRVPSCAAGLRCRRDSSCLATMSSIQSPMDDDPLDLKLSEGFEAPLGRFDGRALNKYLNVAVIVTILCAMVGKVITVDAEISRGWTTFEIITRLVPDNWSGYSDFLQEQPVLTKACTSGFVYTLGDCIAQSTEGKGIAELDRLRVLRSASCGFFAHGPLSHVWYNVAESIFDSLHMSAWYFTPLKVALDQLTWGPFWNALYITLLRSSTGERPAKIVKEIRDTALPLLRDGFKLWVPAHSITYGVIPLQNRLLWVDAVEVLWVIILSSTAAASQKAMDEDEAKQQG